MVYKEFFPSDPITAVTHPDPYPFYAGLVAQRPLYRDDALGVWVAASAGAVTAVLTSDLCRVRPPAEPVPRALVGSPAGEIFRHLVRMTDGPVHAPCKHAVAATLRSFGEMETAAASREWARHLADELRPADAAEGLAGFHFHLPVYTVASLLGVQADALRPVSSWTSDLVAAFAPASTPEQRERGQTAAVSLLELFRALGPGDDEVIVANRIGLLVQSHDATAGLIGNTLVALGRHPDTRERVAADPDLLPAVLLEVLRHDPPVQNTRRFVARDGDVAGQTLREGDAVLVLLAAANRDPTANPAPERFDPFRQERRIFTFGAGAHACPGDALAVAIARAGVERLLLAGLDPERFAAAVTYRLSANARIPSGNE
ncbi:MAG TPA: cytochrome P450 [Thermoanaerobaculia bacterium]|jgi:cytochrome P450|nr:cytochrome P450 [Thermoanaerobaculia bacterium]